MLVMKAKEGPEGAVDQGMYLMCRRVRFMLKVNFQKLINLLKLIFPSRPLLEVS
jgi:hypothetical protein